MINFSDLGLSEPLLKALNELGFEKPTPIQQQAIPLLIQEQQDFIGLAQTGTGKTAAFGLPILNNIDPAQHEIQALILTPTRELGQQVAQHIDTFAKYLPEIKVLAVYGGAPIASQIRDLKKRPQIIIATPGRLIDMINRKAVKLNKLSILVLDEADEMLNMGFKDELNEILSSTPEDKSTWLFSATMPKEIRNIVHKYMSDPAEVAVNTGEEVNVNIEHQYAVMKASDKTEALKRFLAADPTMRSIIFCRTKITTQEMADELKNQGFAVEALHGDLNQSQRDKVMKAFKKHHLEIVIATDVAARGIDVNDLTHVIHHSLPDDFAYYTHRSGRTARAGKKGISLSLITKRETEKIKQLERKLDISFQKVNVPGTSDILEQKVSHWAKEIEAMEVSELVTEPLMSKAYMELKDLSKEDLLKKLVSKELDSLRLENINLSRNINDDSPDDRGRGRDRDRGGRRERGERSERGGRREKGSSRFDTWKDKDDRGFRKDGKVKRERKKSEPRQQPADENMDRYFINIGSVDKVKKRDLTDFIADVAKISPQDIGNVTIEKKHAYFEVDKKHGKTITNSFKDLAVDGRVLRVNRDN